MRVHGSTPVTEAPGPLSEGSPYRALCQPQESWRFTGLWHHPHLRDSWPCTLIINENINYSFMKQTKISTMKEKYVFEKPSGTSKRLQTRDIFKSSLDRLLGCLDKEINKWPLMKINSQCARTHTQRKREGRGDWFSCHLPPRPLSSSGARQHSCGGFPGSVLSSPTLPLPLSCSFSTQRLMGNWLSRLIDQKIFGLSKALNTFIIKKILIYQLFLSTIFMLNICFVSNALYFSWLSTMQIL